jgi:hypothetical protein
MNTLTLDQADKAARLMQRNYGSFAYALSCAYFAADSNNRETLLTAFQDLFQRVYSQHQADQITA